jgi:hypothetical protein
MYLEIENIGKIDKSQIEMNGITVIAGKNNTGKSTFGRVLYCMFNAFYDIDKKVHNERISEIRTTVQDYIFKAASPQLFTLSRKTGLIGEILEKAESFIDELPDETFLKNEITNIINTHNEKHQEAKISLGDYENDMIDKIESSLYLSSDDIKKWIITKYFRSEFAGQINHLNKLDSDAIVNMQIKGNTINTVIKGNECSAFTDNVGLFTDAIYIDTPFIIDELDKANMHSSINLNHRDNLLSRLKQNSNENSVIKEIITKQKITKILKNIQKSIAGEFVEYQGRVFFKDQSIQNPLENRIGINQRNNRKQEFGYRKI